MKASEFENLMKKAEQLVWKLQADIKSGRRKICENYGQKEIKNFIDKYINPNFGKTINYPQVYQIEQILFKVSEIR